MEFASQVYGALGHHSINRVVSVPSENDQPENRTGLLDHYHFPSKYSLQVSTFSPTNALAGYQRADIWKANASQFGSGNIGQLGRNELGDQLWSLSGLDGVLLLMVAEHGQEASEYIARAMYNGVKLDDRTFTLHGNDVVEWNKADKTLYLSEYQPKKDFLGVRDFTLVGIHLSPEQKQRFFSRSINSFDAVSTREVAERLFEKLRTLTADNAFSKWSEGAMKKILYGHLTNGQASANQTIGEDENDKFLKYVYDQKIQDAFHTNVAIEDFKIALAEMALNAAARTAIPFVAGWLAGPKMLEKRLAQVREGKFSQHRDGWGIKGNMTPNSLEQTGQQLESKTVRLGVVGRSGAARTTSVSKIRRLVPGEDAHRAARWKEYTDSFKRGGSREGGKPLPKEQWNAKYDTAIENTKRGNAFEQEVREFTGGKRVEIKTPEGTVRRPDLDFAGTTDVKDVVDLSSSPQLREMASWAKVEGKPFNLIISPRTKTVSQPLQKLIDGTKGTAISTW